MKKLKQRWGITSDYDLMIIFIVFAVNGTLSATIGRWLMGLIGFSKENLSPVVYFIVMTILILPIYPLLLMITGWLGGQSKFFWPFAKRILNRISFGLLFPNKKPVR